MRINDQDWSIFSIIRAFFPLQLLFSHLKHNVISILFWGILFASINDAWGAAFGVPFLFLSPEYLDAISFQSFFLVGFALGGFIMGFNTYSYMRLGPLYPFLITLSRPFFKFCVNNGLIPFVFVLNYLARMIHFQVTEEYANPTEVLLFSLSFLMGIALFLTLSWALFFRLIKTNPVPGESVNPVKTMTPQNNKWYEIFRKQQEMRSLYLGRRLKVKASRSSKHFDRELVEATFAKNRISASLFELLTIFMFFGLGFFNDYEFLEVPAATSIILLFTICLMLYSALHAWLKGWFFPLVIIVVISMNYLSQNSGLFHYRSYAFGLDYRQEHPEVYSVSRIRAIAKDSALNEQSYRQYIQTLNNWKQRTGEEKPKLIIITTSGGGSRSALWTTSVMCALNDETSGNFMEHTQMITGASGGMVGAAFYREVHLRNLTKRSGPQTASEIQQQIGSDILNRLSFMATTNDIFVRYQNVEYNGRSYTKDRGYAFEQQLLNNTNGILDNSLGYYSKFEKKGVIPTMLFTPTIVNDGRRLFIAAQPVNFLSSGYYAGTASSGVFENIDLRSLLSEQDIDQMRFSSVMRASATFPFVMPMMTLPTSPEIQLMDAGIRDNYGTKTMMLYLHSLKDWIKENTSGVIIVEIRDSKKIFDNEIFKQVSFLDKLTLPFGNMYKNFPRVQNYNQEELAKLGMKALDFPIDIVPFSLMQRKEDRISLSWHLTSSEKMKIVAALKHPANRSSFDKVKELLKMK